MKVQNGQESVCLFVCVPMLGRISQSKRENSYKLVLVSMSTSKSYICAGRQRL